MVFLMGRTSVALRGISRTSTSFHSRYLTQCCHLASAATATTPRPVELSTQIQSIHPISPFIGAVIYLPSLSNLEPSTTSFLQQLFLHHSVIILRPDNPSALSPSAFLQIASIFGQPQTYPFLPGITPSYPQIIRVMKQPWETTNFGGIWHSDTTYLESPPKATMLMAEEIPASGGGGDTLFANQYLAYEGLSSGLKQTLIGLKGVNTSAKADTSKTREDRINDSRKDDASLPNNAATAATAAPAASEAHEATHPVIRTHAETGRKALYINIAHTTRFEGWTEAESEPLLRYLHQQQIKNEYVSRHRWRVGDVALWDNRCVLHYPVNDYQGERRSMLRTTLKGERPV